MEINTKNWKRFNLSELFFVTGSQTISKNDLNNKSGNLYPYITTKATNNGVAEYNNFYTEKGNVITIDSAVLGTAFYQKYNFCASDHVEKLIPKFKINENIGLFFVTVLNKMSKIYDYAYIDKRSQTALNKEYIYLPVDELGSPNYKYMEEYIEQIKNDVSVKLNKLKFILNEKFKSKINLQKWKKFHLYDDKLFDIDSGSKLDKTKMKENNPEIYFVGRSNVNNGITGIVDKIKGKTPYEAGNLTLALGGEYLGSCFIQKHNFYTSQNVVVLIPKWDMPFYVKQFIATMVFRESRTYYKAFIDELNRHVNTDFSFYLPVNDNDEIDFDFMNKYMKNMFNLMNENINKFNF